MAMQRNVYEDLHRLFRKEDIEGVKYILKTGVDVTKTDDSRKGATLLHFATTPEICQELILHGARVNARDVEKRTPLHYAVYHGRGLSVVRELLQNGAKVNATDVCRQTPLITAVHVFKKNQLPVVRELLHYGADTDAYNYVGHSALTLAVYYKEMELIVELLEFGADVNIRRLSFRMGYSVLFSAPLAAAMKSDEECAKLILRFTVIKNFDDDYENIINLERYSQYDNYSKFPIYVDKCASEIVEMKALKINHSYSLYDYVIRRGKNIKPLYLKDEVLSKILTRFPIYRDLIMTNIQPSMERAKLLDIIRDLHLCVESEVSSSNDSGGKKEVCLNGECLSQIADYLTNDELFNFVISLYKSDESTNASDTVPNVNEERADGSYEVSSESCSKRLKTSP